MGPGALIGAYQEDDEGNLRALMPLAGRSLLDYQVRAAAAAGCAPVVVLVERVPQALQDVVERLRGDGLAVTLAADVHEAVSRFEAGAPIILVGDGVVLPFASLDRLAGEEEPAVVVVADDEAHAAFERIDGHSRWAGMALIDGDLLASTARMLGDWDLQSTLLRRLVQEGARRLTHDPDNGEIVLAENDVELLAFERRLFDAAHASRDDWAARYLFPPVEEFGAARLLDTPVRPRLLLWVAAAMMLGASALFLAGWPIAALALLVLAAPLDLIAERLANVRLQPLPASLPARRLLWPLAGVAALALAWWHGHRVEPTNWTPLVAAMAALAFAQAARIERGSFPRGPALWLFSRRSAVLLALPFALFGAWTAYLLVLALYAATSFFLLQHARHRGAELTRI